MVTWPCNNKKNKWHQREKLKNTITLFKTIMILLFFLITIICNFGTSLNRHSPHYHWWKKYFSIISRSNPFGIRFGKNKREFHKSKTITIESKSNYIDYLYSWKQVSSSTNLFLRILQLNNVQNLVKPMYIVITHIAWPLFWMGHPVVGNQLISGAAYP